MKLKFVLPLALLVSVIYIDYAYAYIDPNTGGFFFQTVAPFVYAMLGAIVVFWKRITTFISGLFGRNKKQDNSEGRSE